MAASQLFKSRKFYPDGLLVADAEAKKHLKGSEFSEGDKPTSMNGRPRIGAYAKVIWRGVACVLSALAM
jgi:hypothetical protein